MNNIATSVTNEENVAKTANLKYQMLLFCGKLCTHVHSSAMYDICQVTSDSTTVPSFDNACCISVRQFDEAKYF